MWGKRTHTRRVLPVWAALLAALLTGCAPVAHGAPPAASQSPSAAPDVPAPTASAAPSRPAPTKAPPLPTETVAAPTEPPATAPADTVPPVIEGAVDRAVAAGGSVSYREGVTATDDVDGVVELEIDSSAVNLLVPGAYPLTYRARDSAGNETAVTVTVTVTEPAPSVSYKDPREATEEDVYALAQEILDKILKDGMTQRDRAYAIFKYVHRNIAYVGSSDKTDWIAGAYAGFTRRRGDCFTYFSCSKALLTLAGIPNVDLERVGGTTRHYWQLVDVGEGYMHFDACPHNHGPFTTFLLTEPEARAFTEAMAWYRPNYYVYDYASCPVPVVGLDESERRPQPTEPEAEAPVEPETTTEPDTATEPETVE